MDPRIIKLADGLVNFSTRVQRGEHVLIECHGSDTQPLAQALIKAVYNAGGFPHIIFSSASIHREFLLGVQEEQLELMCEFELARMQKMQVCIGVYCNENMNEFADVPSSQMKLFKKIMDPVSEQLDNHTRWVVLGYPNYSMAQAANTSLEAFEDFYFKVCTIDYSKMSKVMQHLKAYMERTDKVHIVGPGDTDLSFSIKGFPAIPCAGELNIPDGEVFTAPVRESVNGVVHYNTPAVYQGYTYEDIRLEFKNGKIVKATSNNTEKINAVFDSDEGARYVGEFSFGVNPYILEPMKDSLFDEKIMGSFHLTPGCAYEMCDNGNKSIIHWDLVCIQRKEYGGGEIYFDGKLIRKDGRFVVPELECLNPENLV